MSTKQNNSIDAPRITRKEARQLPEFEEGKKDHVEGKSMPNCPYAIFNMEFLPSAEWRVKFEKKFDSWIYGFSSKQHP